MQAHLIMFQQSAPWLCHASNSEVAGVMFVVLGFCFFSRYVFSNNSWVNMRNCQGYYIFGRIIAFSTSNVISRNIVEGHNEKKEKKNLLAHNV